MKSEELLFILDIGTRSVIGVIGREHGGTLEILSVESAEHSSRAVVDGQIEDIKQTALVAGQVKARLEQNLGLSLKEVHVAAAGRVLKTEHALYEMDLDSHRPVGEKELTALEAKAVQTAYEKLASSLEEDESADFCSVGHTVMGYQLDGYPISTLLGHRGRRAGVELISTFLPSEVVESLYATMSMLGLSIASMTLEPIAAMNAVVPKELRLLNVALVDVGAGTSDIAVADKGSVCGYAMATSAGDEVTERLMQEFLVDFGTAERMKYDAAAGRRTIEYEDVLGLPYTVELEELLERIRPTVEELARQIADGILSVNGSPPKAVFMVGGGSRTPGLCRLVAQALSIDEKRVAIGGSNYMKRQVEAEDRYLSAEYATPIGIAVTAMAAGGGESLAVSLNGTRLHLRGNSMSVMEALRLGGYQYGQIMGRSGKGVMFEYNGERRLVRGGLPTLAEIQVNGQLAGLSALLQAGDEITFVPARDGEDAAPTLRDAAGLWQPFEVELFGNSVQAGTQGWINGTPASGGSAIRQGDQVQVRQLATVGELLEASGLALPPDGIDLNGIPCTDFGQPLHPGDRITSRQQAPAHRPPEDRPPPGPGQPQGRQGLHILLNGRDCTLAPREDGYQLFTLLNYLDIDPRQPKGEIVLLRNQRPASYLEQIQEGDRIEIHWSQEDASERIPRIPLGG